MDLYELLHITSLSVKVSLTATLLSSAVGVPLGLFLATRARWKRALSLLVNTAMGLPPVLLGLLLYLLLSRSGPLSFLGLLFTPEGMVLSQFLLTLPIVAGLTMAAVEALPRDVKELIDSTSTSPLYRYLFYLSEVRAHVFAASLTALARAISEVGSVIIVGGNIRYHTRVLTTAIVYYTNAGDFEAALQLGGVLVLLYFAANLLALAIRARVVQA
ncbi:MAG: ABC transporter permease [Thermofilum sp.]